MKKKILLIVLLSILIFTGCQSKDNNKIETKTEERTMEYLLDRYVEAYSKADMDAVKDMFPPYYIEYSKNFLNKEFLEKRIEEAKQVYGDDYKITYEVGESTKLTDEELERTNNIMKNEYDAKEDASECYKYEVKIKFKGSLYEDPDSAYSFMGYCKYNDKWYIVSINQL